MKFSTSLVKFGSVGDLALELKKALTAIAAGWNVEHNPDGTHKESVTGVRLHAPTHTVGGSDPVTVTSLAGYPGGSTTFLRADHTFAAPPAASTSGTWLPDIRGDGGPTTGQTYAFREGNWVRIGPLVFISGRVILSATGTFSGTFLRIGNLPVAASSTNTVGGAGTMQVSFCAGLATSVVWLSGFVLSGTSLISMVHMPAAATSTVASTLAAVITNSTDLQFSGCYLAA